MRIFLGKQKESGGLGTSTHKFTISMRPRPIYFRGVVEEVYINKEERWGGVFAFLPVGHMVDVQTISNIPQDSNLNDRMNAHTHTHCHVSSMSMKGKTEDVTMMRKRGEMFCTQIPRTFCAALGWRVVLHKSHARGSLRVASMPM